MKFPNTDSCRHGVMNLCHVPWLYLTYCSLQPVPYERVFIINEGPNPNVLGKTYPASSNILTNIGPTFWICLHILPTSELKDSKFLMLCVDLFHHQSLIVYLNFQRCMFGYHHLKVTCWILCILQMQPFLTTTIFKCYFKLSIMKYVWNWHWNWMMEKKHWTWSNKKYFTQCWM